MKNIIRHLFFSKDILIPAILLIGFSVPFLLLDTDIQVSRWFFNPSAANHWPLIERWPWNFLYNYGTWPALGIAIIALLIGISSFFHERTLKYRKKALYLVAVMIIGPGLIVNVIFKDNFGRPRPRDIVEFGGQQQYHQLLQSDWGNSGRSFPCGHCSCAFYFFVFYFLLKGSRRKWLPYAGLGFGIGYGALMGIARIGQGGHFISDVMWSAGLVYLTAGGVYYLMYGDSEIKIPRPLESS